MGLCTELDPTLNPMQVIRPYLEEFVLGKDRDWSAFVIDSTKDVAATVFALPAEMQEVRAAGAARRAGGALPRHRRARAADLRARPPDHLRRARHHRRRVRRGLRRAHEPHAARLAFYGAGAFATLLGLSILTTRARLQAAPQVASSASRVSGTLAARAAAASGCARPTARASSTSGVLERHAVPRLAAPSVELAASAEADAALEAQRHVLGVARQRAPIGGQRRAVLPQPLRRRRRRPSANGSTISSPAPTERILQIAQPPVGERIDEPHVVVASAAAPRRA